MIITSAGRARGLSKPYGTTEWKLGGLFGEQAPYVNAKGGGDFFQRDQRDVALAAFDPVYNRVVETSAAGKLCL